jgi:hypothetical protein
VQFVRLEQADRAVLAVVPGVPDDLAAAQPGDALTEQRPPTRRTSSSGTSRRMLSSGPSAATSRPTSPVTFLLFGPVARISPTM